MFEGIADGFKSIFVDWIIWFLENQNSSINLISNNLSQNASQYSPSAFEVVLAIAENVMLPIAGVIITYVAVHEIIDMVVNNNKMHESTTLDIMRWIFKTAIAIFLVANSFTIISAIIEVGSELVLQAIPFAENIVASEGALTLETSLMDLQLIELIMILVSSAFTYVVFFILRLLINLFIIGRIIEIYMYLSVAPIPMATVGNRRLSETGLNYTKNIVALALQGVVILIAIAIYNALSVTFAQTRTLSGDVTTIIGGIFETLALTGALALVVAKSKSIANSIVGAR